MWQKSGRVVLNSVFLLGANRDHRPRYSTKTGSTDLRPDAENLVQVLRTTQQSTREFRDSREVFERIERSLRSVFPEVRQLRTEAIVDPNQQEDFSEIVLDLENGHNVPLKDCGTGVFQITTLLTSAYLKKPASLFLVDEPHSYLHPAAERALVRILEDLAKERGHIFCLATHSSIISSRCRNNLFAVNNRGDDSKVVSLHDSAEILSVLGITHFDLFTYDKVLFTEGVSDVAVFGLVLSFFDKSGLSERVKLAGLDGDGKFKKTKSAHRIKKLLIDASASKARVPVGFLLDSGGRTDPQKEDLKKSLHDPPKSFFGLLARPELEDYLLHSACITDVLQSQRKLSGLDPDPELGARVTKIVEDGAPKGSTVIAACFRAALEGGEYSKSEDSPALAAAILARDASFLKALYDELHSFIEQIGTEVKAATANT